MSMPRNLNVVRRCWEMCDELLELPLNPLLKIYCYRFCVEKRDVVKKILEKR